MNNSKKHLSVVAMLMMSTGFIYAGEVPVDINIETLTEVPNAVKLSDKLVAGGAPSARGLGQAAEQGIRTVIDVREPAEGTAEEADHAQAVGLKYVNIPISVDNFSAAQANQLDQVLNDPLTGPALLHCATGQRAVAVWALQQNLHNNVSAEQAMTDAKQKGLQKPPLISKLETLLKK